VDEADWVQDDSGLYLPRRMQRLSHAESVETRKRQTRLSARRSPDRWTALSALGQLAAAAIAIVALFVALDDRTRQQAAAEQADARLVSVATTEFSPTQQTFLIENRSKSLVYGMELLTSKSPPAQVEPRSGDYYQLTGELKPSPSLEVTVQPVQFQDITYTYLRFAISGKRWVYAAGPLHSADRESWETNNRGQVLSATIGKLRDVEVVSRAMSRQQLVPVRPPSDRAPWGASPCAASKGAGYV
jgi:hypothetical protein